MLFATNKFQCHDPDFAIYSISDGERFLVRRDVLKGSQVFNDMFECCSTTEPPTTAVQEELRIDEKADTLHLLLQLLHSPPAPPRPLAEDEKDDTFVTQIRTRTHEPETMIPWPLLPSLLRLADKYMLSEDLVKSLHEHLLAHAPMYPIEVYGYACKYGMERIAIKSSRYVAPLASYSLQDVQAVPSVEAYHRLLQLQDRRVKALRKILLEEDMFPYNYGLCLSHHEEAKALWDKTRRKLVGRIETDTDVAGEMACMTSSFESCNLCSKACTAAVEMLGYKCRKVVKFIQL